MLNRRQLLLAAVPKPPVSAVVAVLAAGTIAIGLSACSGLPAQVSQDQAKVATVAQRIQPGLVTACTAATALSPVAGPIAPFIVAGCGTAEAIDKLAADPSSTEWVNGLITQAETVAAAAM
ncbi:MAG TPA: hypothetical protein VFW46_21025 [Stellaceae bacterium]|nr:hypothetical protein [Stellaceae bacterium]